MLFRRILIAYDGSELSRTALDQAIEMARESAAVELEVLCVSEGAAERDARKKLQKAEISLSVIPNPTKVTLLEGSSAAQGILDHIARGKYDLVIIGSRGLTGLSEVLGSVSHSVVQKSPVSVLVIK